MPVARALLFHPLTEDRLDEACERIFAPARHVRERGRPSHLCQEGELDAGADVDAKLPGKFERVLCRTVRTKEKVKKKEKKRTETCDTAFFDVPTGQQGCECRGEGLPSGLVCMGKRNKRTSEQNSN